MQRQPDRTYQCRRYLLLCTIVCNGVLLYEAPWHTTYLCHRQSRENNARFFFTLFWEVVLCSCHPKGMLRSLSCFGLLMIQPNSLDSMFIIKCLLRNVLSLFRIQVFMSSSPIPNCGLSLPCPSIDLSALTRGGAPFIKNQESHAFITYSII